MSVSELAVQTEHSPVSRIRGNVKVVRFEATSTYARHGCALESGAALRGDQNVENHGAGL